MNPKFNNKTRQILNEASTVSHATLTKLQSKSGFPFFVLIKNKGESPPGISRSSGSSEYLHPDIKRNLCNGYKSNNKEEIKYIKAKANYIF